MSSLAPAPQPIGVFPQFLAAGPETLVLKEKVISLSGDSFSIKLANGTPVLQVEGKVMSPTGLLGSKATATFTSSNGKQEVLTMRGNFFDTQADILDEAQGGLVVARIDRKILSGKDIFFGQQTYGVQIAPGVDMALIAALCICLDEKNNEG
ncbi:unnamed protein product [Alternaria alternata]